MSLLLAILAPTAASQQIVYVDDDASPSGDGATWSTAFSSLQDALIAETGAVEFRIAQGSYQPDMGGGQVPGDRDASFRPAAHQTLAGGYRGVTGGGDPDDRDIEQFVTVLTGDLAGDGVDWSVSADGSKHIVRVVGAVDVGLDGLLMEGGNITGSEILFAAGSAVIIRQGSARINNCTFRWNSGAAVGARESNVGSWDSRLSVRSCVFHDNRNDKEGGALDSFAVTVHLEDCLFTNNEVVGDDGGGARVGVDDASTIATIRNCVFVGNKASWRGGGLRGSTHPGRIHIANCVFSNNQARDGGGAHVSGSNDVLDEALIRGCVFRENTATGELSGGGDGGGLMLEDTSGFVVDCEFVENDAGHNAGGLWYRGNPFNGSHDPTILNCRFLGNSAHTESGGGLTMYEVDPLVVNCEFIGNYSRWAGAGFFQASSGGTRTPEVANCSFVGNRSIFGAAGMYAAQASGIYANCVFWGNSSQQATGQDAQVSGPFRLDYCCVQDLTAGFPGSGNIFSDPLFLDVDGFDNVLGTSDDSLEVSSGSPCIDAASNLLIGRDGADLDDDGSIIDDIEIDLLGHSRRLDDPLTPDTGDGSAPVVDMGAREYRRCYADTYCEATSNSSGEAAILYYDGSLSIAANDSMFVASGIPVGAVGALFYGPEAQQVPFGDGWLCVDPGNLGLFRPSPPSTADGAGLITVFLDFTVPPLGSGPGEVLPGETWFFQVAYRDSGGSGFNASTGIALVMCP